MKFTPLSASRMSLNSLHVLKKTLLAVTRRGKQQQTASKRHSRPLANHIRSMKEKAPSMDQKSTFASMTPLGENGSAAQSSSTCHFQSVSISNIQPLMEGI